MQIADDRSSFFLQRFGVRSLEQRDVADIFGSRYPDLLRLEMLDQRIETGVLGDDVKVGCWIFIYQLPDVIRYVEIQRVAAIAGNFDVAGTFTQVLNRGDKIKRDFCLICPHEDRDAEEICIQAGQ